MRSRWRVVALAVGLVAWLVVATSPPADPFRDKYDQIRPEMSPADVAHILGPPEHEIHPGGSLGETIHFWSDGRGRAIRVTWPLFAGEPARKELIP